MIQCSLAIPLAIVHSKSVVLLLLIHCLLLLPLFVGFCVLSLFCNALLSFLSSFVIIPLRKRESWLLYFNYVLAVVWLLLFCARLFLTVLYMVYVP